MRSVAFGFTERSSLKPRLSINCRLLPPSLRSYRLERACVRSEERRPFQRPYTRNLWTVQLSLPGCCSLPPPPSRGLQERDRAERSSCVGFVSFSLVRFLSAGVFLFLKAKTNDRSGQQVAFVKEASTQRAKEEEEGTTTASA